MIRRLRSSMVRAAMLIKYIFVLFFFLFLLETGAQDQRVFDSLKYVYRTGDYKESLEFVLLRKLTFHTNNVDTSLYYAKKYLDKSNELEDKEHIGIAHGHMGNAYRLKGDYVKAVDHYISSLELARGINDKKNIASALAVLGDIYSVLENHHNAVKYYQQSLEILRTEGDSTFLASVLLNLGDEYYSSHQLDSALICFVEAGKIYKLRDYRVGLAYTYGNLGLVYAEQGKSAYAENNIQRAVDILEEMKDYYGISVYLTYMADIYEEKNEIGQAIKYASKSLQLANSYGLKEQIRDASLTLSELFEIRREIDSAYHYHKQYVAYRDSINNEETIQKIADLRTEYEVGQKQAEVDVLTAQQRTERVVMAAIGMLAIVLLILGLIVYKYYKQKSKISLELARLNQTKDKFFSIISHDLRGPGSSFMGISRMIKFLVQADEKDQLLEMADDIDDSVERLSALLDNLLNWAMQQQGHFPNVPEKVMLNELAEELVKTLKNMAQGKQIALKAEIPEPIYLWVDRNTTMTILRNLVNNALKFTPEGGKVVIKAMQQGEQAIIEVKDTGVGMPAEKLNSLFKLQDKKSTYGTAGEKGLGLGLQLVYEFVEMNRGRIEVTSQEDQGTTFRITLPLYDLEEEAITT